MAVWNKGAHTELLPLPLEGTIRLTCGENRDSEIDLGIMHYSYSWEGEKKSLSLSYTEVHTSVMISSQRGQAAHQPQDGNVPSPTT